jgi:hypothetical protein
MDALSGVRDNWFKLAASTLLVFAATCSGSAEDKRNYHSSAAYRKY